MRFFALALLAAIAAADPNAPCYDPTGHRVDGWYPCNPNAFVSTCCPQGWACYSNSLCVVVEENDSWPNLTVGAVTRTSCTNPEWVSEICGKFCLHDPNISGEMGWCEGTKFCCQGDLDAGDCDCKSKKGLVDPGEAKPNTIIGVSGHTPPTRPTFLPAQKHTATSTASTSKTSTTAKPSSSGPGETDATATSTSASTQAEKNKKKKRNIGIGVGVSLGVLLLAGIVGIVILKKRRPPPASPQMVEPIHRGPVNVYSAGP